jgi:predicted cytidylate kinase
MTEINRKRIITIAGPPGSGKSTTAKKVAHKLEYTHFSSGDIFREIAKGYDLDVAGLNKLAEDNFDLDYQVDSRLRQMGEDMENLVVDSRTAFHWIPQSFKVYLDLDIETASSRVFEQIVSGGRVSQFANSVNDVKFDIETRINSELKRYHKLYKLDYTKSEHYDLIINTVDYNVDEVAEIIIRKYIDKHL